MEAADPETKNFIAKQAHHHEKMYQAYLASDDVADDVEASSRDESMTLATTLESSRQITPQAQDPRRMTVVDLISDDDVVETHPPPFDDTQATAGALPKKRRKR